MKKSKHQMLLESNNDIKNIGFDYEGKLFKNTISSFIYENDKMKPMLLKLEEITHFTINQIKTIKEFYNYAMDNNKFYN